MAIRIEEAPQYGGRAARVDEALAALSPTFTRMYAADGRPSIPPEHVLKGCLLMALFSVRSERQFCQRLRYDMLFKWFLDLNIMDDTFNHSVFSKNKERLLEVEVSREFFREIVDQSRGRRLLSEGHFSVDGTLLEAWASMKSFGATGVEPSRSGEGGLRGVLIQSEDAVERIRRIDDLFSIWKERLARGQSRLPERALDLFAENPFWTVGGLGGVVKSMI